MSGEQPPKIVIEEHGPYVVTGGPALTRRAPSVSAYGEPLQWDYVGSEEADYPTRERFRLCRCGQSSTKPYCDDTHKNVGFDGTLTGAPGQRSIVEGDRISLTDDPRLCEHAGFCSTRLTNVWQMLAETSDPEVRERVRQMIGNCPSGRLGFGPGHEDMEPVFEPSIATIKDGPLWVRGGIEVEAEDGTALPKQNRMTLCRCGESANKPYCDGNHRHVGFVAD